MAKHDTGADETFIDRANSALSQISERSASQVDNSPLIALAGGIAIGALIAALLPQTDRETELLQPVGTKVNDAGRAGIDKMREAGKAKVDELAGDKLRDFFGYGQSSSTAA
ncbi:MAG: hypothetical protein ABIQ98_00855 [Sphingomicrobium sp.]